MEPALHLDIDAPALDALDRSLIQLTQEGLPLSKRPYHELAVILEISAQEVQTRLARMLDSGVIRRIGAVPNHYRLGYTANGMSVWDIPDAQIDELGARVGALPFVSHCYHRPRNLPSWPYNLFAMVHGRSRAETDEKVERIAQLLGASARQYTVLYSAQILKKTGLRIQ